MQLSKLLILFKGEGRCAKTQYTSLIKMIRLLPISLCLWILYSVCGASRNLRGVPIMRNDAQCNRYYLGIVHYGFERTTIVPKDSTEIEYCEHDTERRRESRSPDDWEFLDSDLTEIINFYQSLPYVVSSTVRDGPIETYGLLAINDNTQLPLYMTANILYPHTRGSRDHNFPSTVDDQMAIMGQYDTDDKGHLLARSLGGSNEPVNVIPMARNLNRHRHADPERKALGLPTSYWRSIETWIQKFLETYRSGRVAWRLALQYPNDTIINPADHTYFRPHSVTLQYTAFTDRNDDNTEWYRSPQITFLNDNDYACGYAEAPYRQKRDMEDMCPANTFPRQPQGKIDRNQETSHGQWAERYEVSFHFSINNKHYFYGQSIKDGHNWFIQELLPNGLMGQETDHGFWNYNYFVAFPFTINGRTFFYGHSTDSYTWFIQELLPGGKMGSETDHGQWGYRYNTGFYFTIEGKHYFYSQSNVDGHHWFIQELLPDGKMGAETDHGFWNYKYSVSFPFAINGRQFFYGHSSSDYIWCIQELLPGGKMGIETSHGQWNQRYQNGFAFTIRGKHYFYQQSIIDGHNWFVQELLPGGQMGRETDHDFWNYNYPVAFPFTINGRHFLYGSSDKYKWFIQEMY